MTITRFQVQLWLDIETKNQRKQIWNYIITATCSFDNRLIASIPRESDTSFNPNIVPQCFCIDIINGMYFVEHECMITWNLKQT